MIWGRGGGGGGYALSCAKVSNDRQLNLGVIFDFPPTQAKAKFSFDSTCKSVNIHL